MRPSADAQLEALLLLATDTLVCSTMHWLGKQFAPSLHKQPSHTDIGPLCIQKSSYSGCRAAHVQMPAWDSCSQSGLCRRFVQIDRPYALVVRAPAGCDMRARYKVVAPRVRSRSRLQPAEGFPPACCCARSEDHPLSDLSASAARAHYSRTSNGSHSATCI